MKKRSIYFLTISFIGHIALLSLWWLKPTPRVTKASPLRMVKVVLKQSPAEQTKPLQKAKSSPKHVTKAAPVQPTSNRSFAQKKNPIETLDSNYLSELKAYIESRKHYPKIARKLKQSGVVTLLIEISPEGAFKKVTVQTPSKHKILNLAAVKLLSSLEKFKPLPESLVGKTFSIPVAYKLRAANIF